MTNESTTQIAFPLKREVDLKPETLALIQQAAGYDKFTIELKTPDDRIQAADQLSKIKGLFKELDKARTEMKKPFDEAGKEIQNHFTPRLAALTAAEGILKNGMIAYDEEAERQQRLADAAAEEVARKQREALQAKADVLREKGKDEKADALEENAASIAAMPVEAAKFTPVATSGTSTRTNYSAEVTDLLALVKAVAEGKAPLKLLIPDQKVLDGMAKALKDDLDGMYPGVKVVTSKTLAQRSSSPYKS